MYSEASFTKGVATLSFDSLSYAANLFQSTGLRVKNACAYAVAEWIKRSDTKKSVIEPSFDISAIGVSCTASNECFVVQLYFQEFKI